MTYCLLLVSLVLTFSLFLLGCMAFKIQGLYPFIFMTFLMYSTSLASDVNFSVLCKRVLIIERLCSNGWIDIPV